MAAHYELKAYWNLRARDYDEFYNRIMARRQLLAVSHSFLNSLHRRYDICLDLGCGTGRLTESLALVSNKVIAVDMAEEMIRIASQRLAVPDFIDKIEWVQQDVLAFLQERDSNSVDICAAGLLTHQMDPPTKTKFIAECHRTLRNAGDLFITEQVVCDKTLAVPTDLVGRRKGLYEHIVKGFYLETGPPQSFRDDFEYTDTATELFERLRQGGFSDLAFYEFSPIAGLFAAKKRSRDYVPAGFPQMNHVAVGTSGINFPGSLADRLEIISEEPVTNGRRILVRLTATGNKAVIDLGKDSPEYNQLLAQKKDIADLLGEHGIACCRPLEYALEDNVRFLVCEYPEGVPCTPDVLSRLSLYDILNLMRYLLRMQEKLGQLGIEHMLIPAGLVLNEASKVIINDLRLLRPTVISRLESGADSASLNRIGHLIADSLRLHVSRFGGTSSIAKGDLSEYLHSLPTKLIDLLKNLASTPPRINTATAIMNLDRFLGFRANRGLTVESSLKVNKDFISLLEFETMPPSSWTSIWELCRKNAAHRDLFYAVLQKYVSVYSNSNLFGILATHDYEEFRHRTKQQLFRLRIRNVILERVSFQGWRLEECEIKDCRFQNCDFSGATFRSIQFVNCDFAACSFSDIVAESSYMVASQLYDCDLRNAIFAYSNFERSKLVGCVLNQASVEGANFHSATVSGSIGIESCNLRNVNAFNVDDDEAWRKAISRVSNQKLATYSEFEKVYSGVYEDKFKIAYEWLRHVTK